MITSSTEPIKAAGASAKAKLPVLEAPAEELPGSGFAAPLADNAAALGVGTLVALSVWLLEALSEETEASDEAAHDAEAGAADSDADADADDDVRTPITESAALRPAPREAAAVAGADSVTGRPADWLASTAVPADGCAFASVCACAFASVCACAYARASAPACACAAAC
eukprot:6212298-Pleurochrysis_carterae.AAC.2